MFINPSRGNFTSHILKCLIYLAIMNRYLAHLQKLVSYLGVMKIVRFTAEHIRSLGGGGHCGHWGGEQAVYNPLQRLTYIQFFLIVRDKREILQFDSDVEITTLLL